MPRARFEATEAADYSIHTDRHLIGLPRLLGDGLGLEAPFAVYQAEESIILRRRNFP